jgi:predicted nucleic-acid-binding protein
MIGIDTNVLLRLWLDDDPAQSRRIDALLAAHGSEAGSLMVSDVVLVEAVWTLGSVYAQAKADQLRAVHSLLDEAAFAFENRDAVTAALAAAEQATCGFSDCLIAAKHAALGCTFTATFDKRMRKLQGVRLI